jgi:5'-deoxy-5'-methylthioadenosine phosphorylase
MLAIIGGSGLYGLGDDFATDTRAPRATPYGDTSADILLGRWHGLELAFLPRHGEGHRVPPHRVNYRANIWALKQQGARRIISVNAVGGIAPELAPQTLAVPDQIIDYSSGREQSFFDGGDEQARHIDFSWPYDPQLRAILVEAGERRNSRLVNNGTYGCTNGPRLETAAEILRMRNDGCSMVGMTGMPEAALARELELGYACLALVVNWAAGIQPQEISMQEIIANVEQGMREVKSLLAVAAGLARQ